jgi:hypothetical protein
MDWARITVFDGIELAYTELDETPMPLGDPARGDWPEADLTGFLDEYVGPVVADPEAFAAEFAAWPLVRFLQRA